MLLARPTLEEPKRARGMVSSVGSPQGMLDTHSISPDCARVRSTNWWISVSSSRHSRTEPRAPVMSSICDSL